MGDLGGQKSWRLGLIRLTAGNLAPAVCVVSEARAKRGRMFRMMALAVGGEMRGQGLATGAIRRLKEELSLVAGHGPRFGLMADLASCMRNGGAGFYARQGWTGGKGSWSWRPEAFEVEGAGVVPGQGPAPAGGSGEAQAGDKAGGAEPEVTIAGGAGEGEAGVGELEAPEVEWGQVQQAWEQDVSATGEALSDSRGVGELAGKRKRGDELAHQPVRHPLWEQGPLD